MRPACVIFAVILVGCGAPSTMDGGPDAARADGGRVMTDAARAGDAGIDARVDGGDDRDADLGPLRALLFTRTTGFPHPSIADGTTALEELATARGWILEASEDPTRFTDAGLDPYDVLVFLSTTGELLDMNQQEALERYIRDGGGFVGIHAAADAEYAWPFYGELVGAWFQRHPAIQLATLHVEDRTHPATMHLDATWMRTDEWYDFQSNPRDDVNVLITIDEASYSGGEMGADHPVSWWREYEGGRSFYTALGHTSESYTEPAFLTHVAEAIEWAAGH